MNSCKIILSALSLSLLLTAGSLAGPPFLTDDPEPVDYGHWEAYLFTMGDYSRGAYAIQGPAMELNYGALPETQLHLIVPAIALGGRGVPRAFGLGDAEFGIKYRFVHESNWCPQIGIFPAAELPTGDASRGLGYGRTWFRLPLWLQKSWGQWTTYGGGGVALNSAPGQRDYPFGGWMLQRKLGDHLSLGSEVFAQGRPTDTDKGFAVVNVGGSYNVNEHFSFLFSGGHTIAGESHTLWYFGLYRTW